MAETVDSDHVSLQPFPQDKRDDEILEWEKLSEIEERIPNYERRFEIRSAYHSISPRRIQSDQSYCV